ncbi:MAG: hypothetical protein JWP36_772 [Paucimonas sp.]|nr:hypothetical protein [Paucimonas sp.]
MPFTQGATASLAIASAIAASAYSEPTSSIDPATVLGLSGAVCSGAASNTINGKLFYKVAATAGPVKNELKPYGELPRSDKQSAASRAAAMTGPPGAQPLWNDLGSVRYRITTDSPRAQQYFNQGLRLNYAFNHEEAARAFRTAQKLDPTCAMCYWGEALVLGPNINKPMDPAAAQPAALASAKAYALMRRTSASEQELIKALAARYSEDPNVERAALDVSYANAMSKVAAAFPQDQDVGVLYAEALMNLSPWDYWEAGGARPKGRTADLVATLENVLKANPNHPGAIHYYIHTVEASTNPKRAEAFADRLGQLMPGAGHIVHMPSHIYYRVGRYKDSLAANKKAVAVDENYIASQKPAGFYPVAYYPHNVHFELVSAQMGGDGPSVIAAANKLAALVTDEAARSVALAQPVKVAPYFAHAQFSSPDTILALPAPGTGMPYVEGMWHYARGVALANKGDAANARKEAEAIRQLRQSGDFANLTQALVPASAVMQIAAEVVDARTAQAKGDWVTAATHFEQAAALEDKLAYMEPPYWYYPVRQSLGAVLLQKGDLDGAERAFRASLMRAPNNGWSLYGLSELYRKRGDARSAAAAEQLLKDAWAGDRAQLSLARL